MHIYLYFIHVFYCQGSAVGYFKSNLVCSLSILKEEHFLEKIFKVRFKLFCLWGTNSSGHYNMG